MIFWAISVPVLVSGSVEMLLTSCLIFWVSINLVLWYEYLLEAGLLTLRPLHLILDPLRGYTQLSSSLNMEFNLLFDLLRYVHHFDDIVKTIAPRETSTSRVLRLFGIGISDSTRNIQGGVRRQFRLNYFERGIRKNVINLSYLFRFREMQYIHNFLQVPYTDQSNADEESRESCSEAQFPKQTIHSNPLPTTLI